MNELFAFREELTEKEIGQFVNELLEVSLDSFSKVFEMAKNKIQEYPHCDLLIYSTATVLNAALPYLMLRKRKRWNTMLCLLNGWNESQTARMKR